MALIFVLWVMVILCAVALQMHFSSHLRLQVTANMGDAAKASYLARAGVEQAVAELNEEKDRAESETDLRDSVERTYESIELGNGTYTLYAGMDRDGEPQYGIMDETAKIHLNKASAETLGKVPGMDADLVAAIEELRKIEECHDLNDLLLIEQVDLITLYGEDQNRNGILDPNEDDGDQSWPPDDGNGWLDAGLSAYLTTWSAVRNVTAEGEERVDLNSADASKLAQSIPGIDEQQAQSIVSHRDKSKFTSIIELLDVELVEKAAQNEGAEQSGGDRSGRQRQGRRNAQDTGSEQPQEGESSSDEGGEEEQGADKAEETDNGNGENNGNQNNQRGRQSSRQGRNGGSSGDDQVKGTGQKAFDMAKFREIADYVTTSEDEVIQGLVNVNTASYEVLACLPGIDETLAQNIVYERQGSEEGFQTTADLLDVDGVSEDVFKKICDHVTARSDVFSVRSFGLLHNSDIYRCVYAVIDRTGEAIRFKYWQELE